MIITIFSFYSAHTDLHSFPTRRSSDLENNFALDPAGGFRLAAIKNSTKPGKDCSKSHQQARQHGHVANQIMGLRSEEHTSELQSRLHLVCRLLLEKKKIIICI